MLYLKNVRNFLTYKFLYCHYIIICSIIISYCVINSRLFQTLLLNKIENVRQSDYQITPAPYVHTNNISMKYILLWTNSKNYPFIYFGEGNSIFVNKSCEWTNCYVTGDKNYLGAYMEFDVIVFNGPQLPLLIYKADLPKERYSHQKYVYANIESAANYPWRNSALNNFFNWTWTYKLNSDAVWGYIVIRDSKDKIIGPKQHMHWLDIADMDPIDDNFKMRLQSKKTAAAWISSFCHTSSLREDYVRTLQLHLSNYNLKIDMYGKCGDKHCPQDAMPQCLEMLKKNYYFYLAFENSFSEDYVTEKLLYALNYDTIPIVYGGANYSRFLPNGSYLDAVKLGTRKLAEEMNKIINDRERFYGFFRWKKYYSYHYTHEDPKTDVYCIFCSMINNGTLLKEHTTYRRFNYWWMQGVTKII